MIGALKLTVQVKLQPSENQTEALRRTLETVNQACNWLSEKAWETKEFRQFPLHRSFYKEIRATFDLTAQAVVRLIAKVANAYELDRDVRREFRKHGAIAYDNRILTWNMAMSRASLWSVDGRLDIPFVCGERQRELLGFQRGETDLVYRDAEWFLFTTVEVPDTKEREALDWLGCDFGIVNLVADSDGNRYSGAALNGKRQRNQRLRKKLQKKGSRAAKRLLRKRRIREQRHASHINHCISKKIVTLAERTGRGISLEDLKGIRNRVRAKKSERQRLHSWAFYQLGTFVAYKAARAGVPVRFVDPRNTSRTCSRCDCVDPRNRKTRDAFRCVRCGHEMCADVNAAKNIRRAACKPAVLFGLC